MKTPITFLFIALSVSVLAQQPRWPAPDITDENFNRWMEFIQPSEKELKWTHIRWHKELADAQAEAQRLQRPILLFTMNGHPCGET